MVKDSIQMVSPPVRLATKSEILMGLHNEILDAITRNEVKLKTYTEYVEDPEILSTTMADLQALIPVLAASITEQRISLRVMEEALVEEDDKEAKARETKEDKN